MTREGVDFSYAPPSGAELKAAGKTAAMVYITDPGPGAKGITQARLDDLTAHGVDTAFVYERGNAAALKGREQGRADARDAQTNLKRLRGDHAHQPVYFAVDFDAQPNQYAALEAYFLGVADVLTRGRTGVYGSAAVVEHLGAKGLVAKRWQTYAWSHGKVLPGIDVLQYENDVKLGSGTVDLCRFLSADWGQETPDHSAPAHQPAPVKGQRYTVKDGDTLSSIGAHFHTTWQALYAANKGVIGRDPNAIRAGETLVIP